MNYSKQLSYTKMSMREVLGAELKKIRMEEGVSMNEISLRIGCCNRSIAAAENGVRSILPTQVIVMLLAMGTEPSRIAELIEYAIS